MAYFVWIALRGFILICIIKSSANALEMKGHLPGAIAISNFMDSFVKPYIKTVFANQDKPDLRAKTHKMKGTGDDSSVQDVIEATIAELKPLLEDDDKHPGFIDNFTLEGNDDETTIIEFVPHIGRIGGNVSNFKKDDKVNTKFDSFKSNIEKYKTMRSKIKKMLQKGNISNNIKDTVLNTLDEIIAQLVQNQCTWKSVDRPISPQLRNHQLHSSISKLRNLSDEQWAKLKKDYQGFLQNKLAEEDSFLDMFHEFFTEVVNDTQSLSKKYKIRCQLIEMDKDKQETSQFRAFGDNKSCGNFKLCSEELGELMTDLYNHLNETTVSGYKNYAAMYEQDVNMEVDGDKNMVIYLVNKLGDVAEDKVAKVFKMQTKHIELDKNKDKRANVKHLKEYIKSIVEHTKKQLKRRTESDLISLTTKLYVLIKEDLDLNLDVDLGNLERLFLDRVCTRFVLCNGRYVSRRSKINMDKRNNVFVQVQLTLDDEMKEGLAQAQSKFMNFVNSANAIKGSFRKNMFKDSFSNITVTRTTSKTVVTTNATIVDTHINEV